MRSLAPKALLQIRDLHVDFGGFKAIDGVELTVDEGELRFVIGPSGAGKTTLVDVVTGLTKATRGSVTFDGRELLGLREHDIVKLGVGRSFQTPTVFEHLTTLENVDLAGSFRHPKRSLLRQRRGISDDVAHALDTVGLTAVAERSAGALSHGQKQWLEIAMLLVQRPRLMLLDEPVAGMTKEERARTGELLQQIAETRTVLVIEHDMEFLRRFARKVTVLHEGSVLCEGSVAEVQANPHVQEVYLGRSRDKRSGAVV
jgi:urea transport system ATP-binding protein